MSELDAAIFHRYAEYLWQRAGGVVRRWTIGGALVGAALGSVMLSPWANWHVSHRQAYLVIALGAISGAVLGRSLGSGRALGLRLQAQLAQHQLQFERSTLARAVAETAAAEQPAPVVAPYVPAGVPPVSAVEPQEPEAHEPYGWAALEPSVS